MLGVGYLVAFFLMDAPWQLLVASMHRGGRRRHRLRRDADADPRRDAPPREAGSAVGLNALMRSVGTTLAAAVMGTILTSSHDAAGAGDRVPTEGAFQLCFLAGAVAAFAGVAITAAIPRQSVDGADPAREQVGAAA